MQANSKMSLEYIPENNQSLLEPSERGMRIVKLKIMFYNVHAIPRMLQFSSEDSGFIIHDLTRMETRDACPNLPFNKLSSITGIATI